MLSQIPGQIIHALLTRAPLNQGASPSIPFDLHVLGTPPAFVLSQDQTLQFIFKPNQKIESDSQINYLIKPAIYVYYLVFKDQSGFVGRIGNLPYRYTLVNIFFRQSAFSILPLYSTLQGPPLITNLSILGKEGFVVNLSDYSA
jgi:hypothetical protein